MTSQSPSYHGYRLPPEIISHAVWLYHRFCVSFRDVEDLLALRDVTVAYETIRQWCQTYGRDDARRLRRRRGRMGNTSCRHRPRVPLRGTVKLTKTRLTGPQDDGLEPRREPGYWGSVARFCLT